MIIVFYYNVDFLILDVTPLKEEAVVMKKYGATNRVSFAGPTESEIYRNSLLEQLLMVVECLWKIDQDKEALVTAQQVFLSFDGVGTQACIERFDAIVNLSNCKMTKGSLEYKNFILNYSMNKVEGMIVSKLHNMLKTAERCIEKKLKDVLVVATGSYNKSGGHWSRTYPNGPTKKDKKNIAKTLEVKRSVGQKLRLQLMKSAEEVCRR
ncbi:hypothetical protein Tco_0571615 [Tanacetum coccineum]